MLGMSAGAGGGPQHLISTFGREAEGKAFDAKVARRLLVFLKPHVRQVVFGLILMTVASGLSIACPYLLKVALDGDIARGDVPGLTRTAILLALAYLGTYGATAGQRWIVSAVGQRILSELRGRLFRRIQELHLGYHDTHIVGVTVSRLINDVGVINDLISQGLIALFGDVFVLAGIMTVMILMDARLALLCFSVMPLMVLATWLFSRQAKQAFRNTRSRIAAVVGDLAENISGMRVIQAFGQEETTRSRFREVNRANRDANIRAMSLSFAFLPVVDFLGVLASGIVLWFGGKAVAAETLTIGTVVAFLNYVTRFFQPIQELSQLYTTFQTAMAGGERVFELLDAEPAVQDPPGAPAMPPIGGRIEFSRVSFHYKEGVPVLRDVDLTVEPGQMAALVGPTGAGKTTIAFLLQRFADVSGGAIRIDGTDLRTVSQASLRSQMALVPQDPFLFSGTVADNIRFSRPGASAEEVERAARTANAHGFISRLPDGYDTRILEGAANLSVGQRQLLCIARAVLCDPRILIMDEATANIDTVTELLIQKALVGLFRGRTSVVIAHRLSTVRGADLICVIQDGRVTERGTHAGLLSRAGAYATLYSRQFVSIDPEGTEGA